MFRKCFSLPLGCRKEFFMLKLPVFLETGYGCVLKRGAGHAKWQNIKSTKESTDYQKSQNFQRLSRQIILAVKSGGDDPALNSKLKLLIEEATRINMPKATVQKSIMSAKSSQAEQPYWIVYKGPRGIALGFEVTFANKNSQFLNSKLGPQTKKLKLKMEVHFHDVCSEKGVIIAKGLSDDETAYDKALEHAMEVGAVEVTEGENKMFIFECLPERLDGVCVQLTKIGYNIESATIELDFKEQVVLTEQEKKDVETIVSKLQDQYEEIIRVCCNSAV